MGLTGSQGSDAQGPTGAFLSKDGRWRWNGREWERVVPAPTWVAESQKQAVAERVTALARPREPMPDDRRRALTWKELIARLAGRLRPAAPPREDLPPPPGGSRSLTYQRTALRVLVFGVCGLLLLLGARDLVLSFARPERPTPQQSPVTQQQSFPREAAEAFAVRFATAYLTYDQANPKAREQALQPYLGEDATTDWNGQGSQSVLAAYPSSTDVRSSNQASVTVQAEVSGNRWLYLAVPVSVQRGPLGLAGPPAFVSPPPVSEQRPGNDSRVVDGPLTEQVRPTIQNFFAAWAKDDRTQLAYYSAPGSQLPAGTGMASADVQDVKVFAGEGATRDALAKVTWGDAASSAQLTQTYSLRLVSESGRWLIQGVGASA